MSDLTTVLPLSAGSNNKDPKRSRTDGVRSCVPRSPVGVITPQIVPPAANANELDQDKLPFFVSARAMLNINYKQQIFPKKMSAEEIEALKKSYMSADTQGMIVGAGEKDWRATYSFAYTGFGDSTYNSYGKYATQNFGLSLRIPATDTFVNYSKEVNALSFKSGEIIRGQYDLTEKPSYYRAWSGWEISSSDYVTVRSRVSDKISLGGMVKFIDADIADREYTGTAEFGYYALLGVPYGFGTAVSKSDGKMIYGVDLDIARVGNLGVITDGSWTSVVYSLSIGFGG